MDKFRRADGYLFDTNGKFALVFVKFARLFADFLSAKFTLFFAKFYESRFFMQAKFDAKFIPHKPSRFCYFIKIRGLTFTPDLFVRAKLNCTVFTSRQDERGRE